MARFLPDDIDFSDYEKATEFKAKVLPPAAFEEEVKAEFERAGRPADPSMRSTKLGSAIQFRPAEVTVWAGFSGHRKSTITGQVALDLVQQDQRTLIVSLEMPPRRTLARMVMQACAHDRPDPHSVDRFMRWSDGRLWLFDHVGPLSPVKAVAVLRYFADELQGKHVFIDSFMKVVKSEEQMDAQKDMVERLCELAKETRMHLHLVAHCRKPPSGSEDKLPTKYDVKGSGSITDQPDNVLMVWENKRKRAEELKPTPDPDVMRGPDGVVIVDKQRNGSVEGKFGLHIDPRSLRFSDYAGGGSQPYDMERP